MERSPASWIKSVVVTLLVAACASPGAPGGDARVINDRAELLTWKAVGAGVYTSCAIAENGERYCWGFPLVSNCAQAPCAYNVRPTLAVGGNVRFDSVSSGGSMHCGIDGAAAAYCWGDSFGTGTGSLGDGVTTQSEAPVRVSLVTRARAISAGYVHACALDEAGDAYCWGFDAGGNLGYAIPGPASSTPRKVETTVRFRSVSTGTTHTCAVAMDDIGYCWGRGNGALGAGARDTACAISSSCLATHSPTPVEGGIRWSVISAGNGFTCGVSLEHRGYCWGAVMNNGDPNPPPGMLGSGSFDGSKAPVAVAGDLQFKSIVAGTRQACGLTLAGAAFCWGSNIFGELGIGVAGGRYPSPQPVVGGLSFLTLSLSDHSCGISVNHNLYCWGATAGGRLGNGQSSSGIASVPTRVMQPVR